jgi:cytochrome P450 family 13
MLWQFIFKFSQFSPMLGDLDHTKRINMIVAQGKRWKRLRIIATPAFSTANLKRVMPIIDDSIRVTMRLLEEASKRDNNMLNVHKFFVEMAFDIISRISMGQRESRQFCNDRLELAEKCFQRINNSPEDYVAFMFPWVGQNVLNPLMSLLGTMIGNPLETLLHTIYEAVKERREQKAVEAANAKIGGVEVMEEETSRRVDFIDLLLEAEDDDVKLCNDNKAFNKTEKVKRKISFCPSCKFCYSSR